MFFKNSMNIIFLQLGSNIGCRQNYIETAVSHIEQCIGKICAFSNIYESTPWRVSGQNNYLNQIIKLESNMSAVSILYKVMEIEKRMGRVRLERWGERIIDIDILFYNDDIIETQNLCIPHKHIQDRLFVLKPLLEIAADFIHPVYKLSVRDLFIRCSDSENVQEYEV